MPENLLIHICVHIFMKIKDLTYTSKTNLIFIILALSLDFYKHLIIPLHNLSTYHLNKNYDLHYMCIILQNVKRSPNPHLC